MIVLARSGLEIMYLNMELLQTRDPEADPHRRRTLCYDSVLCIVILRARSV